MTSPTLNQLPANSGNVSEHFAPSSSICGRRAISSWVLGIGVALSALAGFSAPANAGSAEWEGQELPRLFDGSFRLPSSGRDMRFIAAIPADMSHPAARSAVILVHGLGTFDEQADRWVPYAEQLARNGFVAIYPDVRILKNELGPQDCVEVARALKAHPRLAIDHVAVVGGSAGNLSALSSVQIYTDEFDAYVDLYGGLELRSWGHLDSDALAGMEVPVLSQVGENDHHAVRATLALDRGLGDENPELPRSVRIYEKSGHGFFFRDTLSGQAARRDQIEFLWWALVGGDVPQWY